VVKTRWSEKRWKDIYGDKAIGRDEDVTKADVGLNGVEERKAVWGDPVSDFRIQRRGLNFFGGFFGI
jgi:hypothetical protein